MLKTKCILAPKEDSDGLRISIMSRHTKNDGTTPDERITEDSFDVHKTDFAPPQKLIGSYYRGLPWEDFERGYFDYLKSIYYNVMGLAGMAMEGNITLLCIEESPKRCHRRLLAEKCKNIYHELEISIK